MLLCPSEHTSCFNYEKNTASLSFRDFRKGEIYEADIFATSVLFIYSGKMLYFAGKQINAELCAGTMILELPGSHIHIKFEEDSILVINRLHDTSRLCDCFPIEKLFKNRETLAPFNSNLNTLPIHPEVKDFLHHYIRQTRNGLKCGYYGELKSKELFFLFRAYYEKEDLARFFAPLVSRDMRFTHFVYKNYRNVNSVNELVELSQYSVSGFKKQFQKTFGMPPSEWLREQKAKMVYHELNCSMLSIKELCYKFDFASVPSFNAFCKNHFGMPPGEVRKRLLKSN